MGKLLTRLLIVVLLVLSGYLYVQVVQLEHANAALSQSVKQLASVQAENARLRARLAQHPAAQVAENENTNVLTAARYHVQRAEAAAARGDFGTAVRETQLAHDTLSHASDQASAQTRQAVADLRNRLQTLQNRAGTIWRQFGG